TVIVLYDYCLVYYYVFFFQAEDGIRDRNVTGVQTCALPISSWFMTIIIVFVLGGLSFTKTVISTIVSSSLKQQEAGAGMSLLNFTSFLSEGTGIAIVGGLLSIPLLDQRLLPMEVDQST